MLDGLREVVSERRELLEASLEVLPLRGQLRQSCLLLFVLLLGQRVHLAERLAPAFEPFHLVRELVTVVAVRGRSAGGL